MPKSTDQKLYRVYTIKRGEIVRQSEFEARGDREAVAALAGLRSGGTRELWEVSCSPVRIVSSLADEDKGAAGLGTSGASLT